MILSKIGIILLVFLGIIIVLLLLLLFLPFVYRAHVVKNGEFAVNAEVCWLFRFLHVTVSFTGGELDWDVKVAGRSLKGLLTGEKRKEKKKQKEREKAENQPVIMPGEKADRQVAKDAKAAAKHEIKVKKGKKKARRDIYEEGEGVPLIEKIKNRVLGIIEKIRLALKVYSAFQAVKKTLFRLIRHVLPKKIEGFVHFGFEDPSLTGRILAAVCSVYPLIPEKLKIQPDFTEVVFECDLWIKGRIMLIIVLICGLKIYFNKEVKAAMGRIPKKQKTRR